MQRIRAEGLDFFYFTRADDLNRDNKTKLTVPKMSGFMQKNLPALTNVRLVVVPSPLSSGEADIYYMHWRDAGRLDELDQKVQNGSCTDEDFAHSILTTDQITWCRKCGGRWHTLIVPPDTYIGLGDLRRKKLASRWNDVKTCPACKASFGQIVLEILAAEES
jgi:hypothetical protein